MKSFLLTIVFCFSTMIWGQNPGKTDYSNPQSLIHWQVQSSVKNQGVQHTCTAFALAAAIETFPGVPDLSEKYLYALQKSNASQKSTSNNSLEVYTTTLNTNGLITEKELPYALEYDKSFENNITAFDKHLFKTENGYMELQKKFQPTASVFVTKSEYMNTSKIKNVMYIKQLLQNGVKAIPVTYSGIYKPTWKTFKAKGFTTITPDEGYNITTKLGNVFSYYEYRLMHSAVTQEIKEGTVKFGRTADKADYMTHTVTIIGYDAKGFIIKNSYGSDWRMGGFERISYDYHELFATEGMLISSVQNR